MSGYHHFSKSNNAISAEQNGQLPASKIAKKLGVSAFVIKQNLKPSEWHHTSSWYNTTDYYDFDEAKEFCESNEGLKIIESFKQEKDEILNYEDCKVTWLEWGGSRNNPTCSECTEYNAKVSVKGQTATITLSSGVIFKKRLTTNGFEFTAEWTKVDLEAEKERKNVKRRTRAIINGFKAC